jgi:hypothetical protein
MHTPAYFDEECVVAVVGRRADRRADERQRACVCVNIGNATLQHARTKTHIHIHTRTRAYACAHTTYLSASCPPPASWRRPTMPAVAIAITQVYAHVHPHTCPPDVSTNQREPHVTDFFSSLPCRARGRGDILDDRQDRHTIAHKSLTYLHHDVLASLRTPRAARLFAFLRRRRARRLGFELGEERCNTQNTRANTAPA